MMRVMSSMFLHASGFAGSGHHLPLPYVDSRRAAIFVSSSDSFGSDGAARTSATFSRFSWRRWSAGASTLSNLVASFAKRAPASIASWFARAAIASVSSVMKVCCTHPARPCSLPRRLVVSFALSRKVLTSAAVGGAPEPAAHPDARHATARRQAMTTFIRSVYSGRIFTFVRSAPKNEARS